MKILVTGGSGYKGSVLIPKLLKLKHKVISLDTQWFGNHLPKHKNLKNIKFNINDIENFQFKNIDTIIHLASIANDNMSELDKNLSWETSSLATYKLLEKAVQAKVKRFIYASSGSVYGIKKEKKVTENLSLVPITTYNKTKLIFEKILMSMSNRNFKTYSLRPGTICGHSPRIRFDLSVNLLTLSALKNKVIKVFGGSQFRPHIHIKDMIRVYEHFLTKNIPSGIFNTSNECFTIDKLAKYIQKKTKSKLVYYKSNDIRS